MSKMSSYALNASPVLTDELIMIDDPAGTPATKTLTLQALADLINHNRLVYLCNNITTLTNSSAETSIMDTADVGSATLAAAYLTANKTLEAVLMGTLATIGSPGNITIKAKLGSTIIATTGTVALQASQVDVNWKMFLQFSDVTAGASGTVNIQGVFEYGAGFRLGMPNLNLVTVDTTVSKLFGVTAQFSVADPGNTLNTHLRNLQVIY